MAPQLLGPSGLTTREQQPRGEAAQGQGLTWRGCLGRDEQQVERIVAAAVAEQLERHAPLVEQLRGPPAAV